MHRTGVEQNVFESSKDSLYNFPKLSTPNYKKYFCLQSDANEVGPGAIFFQMGGRPEERKVIVYTSKKLSETQKRYAVVKRECLYYKFPPFLETRSSNFSMRL